MHTTRACTFQAAFLATLAIVIMGGAVAQASEYGVLYSFQGDADGAEPNGVVLENGKL
jgi:cyanophycinase-like exopeptidase